MRTRVQGFGTNVIWGYSWSFFSIRWGWWKLWQSFLTLTVVTIGGFSVSVNDVYIAGNRLASISLTSSSELTNPTCSLSFLALLLLLNSLYFFFFTGLQFPDNSSFACPVPFFQPTTQPLLLYSLVVHHFLAGILSGLAPMYFPCNLLCQLLILTWHLFLFHPVAAKSCLRKSLYK